MSHQYEQKELKDVLCIARDASNPQQESAANFIIRKYQRYVHAIIKNSGYFMPGADYDDMVSEGLMGLSKAIQDFDEDKGNAQEFHKKFENFLKVCITRQLISAIKASIRFKHRPLNKMTSFDLTLPENENLSMMDIVAARPDVQFQTEFEFLDPQQQLILLETQERYANMLEQTLSKKEKEVRELYNAKHSYDEMLQILSGHKAKSIDNAIQRFKRKIKEIKAEEDREAEKDY